jgi:glycosyltransferase involved in cell wall biosynthesis
VYLNKHVLFISYDGMTDPLGQSQVIPYLTGLTKYGYGFTILSCDKPKNYAGHKEYIMNLLRPYPIKWVSIPYHKKPPVLSSVYDVLMLKRKARQLHAKENFDMVHTRAGVPALIGLWMKKKLGVKFLNDVREFYADSRVEGGIWDTKNFVYKRIYNFFKKKEDEAVQNSDGIVCLTYAAEKIIKQWPQYNKQVLLEVIPCSVDMDLFDPGKIDMDIRTRFKTDLGISDSDFIITYLGSIGGWYLTAEMITFFEVLSNKIPGAKFLFISPHQHDIIFSEAQKFGVPAEKIIVAHAQRYEVPALLSFSDYSIFFIKPCYSKLSSSPTKHGEIMAMGIPVITNAGVGDVEEIVENYQSGFVLKELNRECYKQYSEMLAGTHFDSKKIRHGAAEFYSLENAVQKYLKIYNQVLAETHTFLPTA